MNGGMGEYTATHCNALQQNTVQHTATHCNTLHHMSRRHSVNEGEIQGGVEA